MARPAKNVSADGIFPYLVVVLALALATFLRWLMDPALGTHLPYVTYFVAVALIAWRCPLIPSLIALFAGWWLAEFFFYEPRYVIFPLISTPVHIVGAAAYFMVGLTSIAVAQLMHRANRRADEHNLIKEGSEARKSAILNTSLDCIVTIDHHGRVIEFNRAAERTFGYTNAEAVGRELAELIVPPSLRARHRAGLERYLKTGQTRALNQRLQLTAMRADGSEFPVEVAITRISEEEPPVFTGYIRDITESKKAEEQRELLLRELNHRVKNTLATVQSIAQQTARFTPDPKQFYEVFSARLISMSRVHDMLTSSSWAGAELRDIAERTLAPYHDRRADSIVLRGPALSLAVDTAILVGLALNELTTNAAKYGALSQPEGRVTITWRESHNGGRFLVLDWHEEDGPPVQVPERSGFGTRLIETVADRLHGKAKLEYAPDGLRCTLEFPLGDAKERK
jgi:PAS domain S-box-containing protein